MNQAPHIVYFATPHGFGHAAIVTAVMSAVARRMPSVRQTVVTTVPEAILRGRLDGRYTVLAEACPTDFGLIMEGASTPRIEATETRYRALHTDLDGHIGRQRERLVRLEPSVVVSCASYTAIAAAADLGIPVYGLGPFGWLEILGGLLQDRTILASVKECYARASGFVLTTPHVAPDPATPGVVSVGPVGLAGTDRTAKLHAAGLLGAREKLIFASLGGIVEAVAYDRWICPEGWRLVTMEQGAAHGVSVPDLIASAHAVVCKPGYGMFVEAAMAGAALISRDRPGWPETDGLHRWYQETVGALSIVSEAAFSGSGPLVTALPPLIGAGAAALADEERAGRKQRFWGAEDCARLFLEILESAVR